MTYTDGQIDELIRRAAPPMENGSWQDVRRRARRRQRPLAIAGAAGLAIAVAAPALAFRNDLTDLWATAEPERNLYVRAFADCGEGSFTLEFHPREGASVRQGDETLATASRTQRTIQCGAPIQSSKGVPDSSPYRGEPDKRSYKRVILECVTDAPLQIAVNPIWNSGEDGVEERATISGSTMLVADRRTKRVLASAVLVGDPQGRNWSRTYWSSSSCQAPGGYDPTPPPGVVP